MYDLSIATVMLPLAAIITAGVQAAFLESSAACSPAEYFP
jgi:hypothetical protein